MGLTTGQSAADYEGSAGSVALAFNLNGRLRWRIAPLGPNKGGILAVTSTSELYLQIAHADPCYSQATPAPSAVLVVQTDTGHLLHCLDVDFGNTAIRPDGTIYANGGSWFRAYYT